ncbi:hypothetical protein [Aliikangiella coralliicola]|uniref:Uncharacterized protein n=1 Tax=Aliikangiella coralliicola TaxID=2592383 RepID=A0A545UCW7_9GAMM|nr:hypothetical protein [Aliikangiella coralliicola]TQV87309.1 hypothetical protein FLL46_12735 [Aliikangiella coralliicola]
MTNQTAMVSAEINSFNIHKSNVTPSETLTPSSKVDVKFKGVRQQDDLLVSAKCHSVEDKKGSEMFAPEHQYRDAKTGRLVCSLVKNLLLEPADV